MNWFVAKTIPLSFPKRELNFSFENWDKMMAGQRINLLKQDPSLISASGQYRDQIKPFVIPPGVDGLPEINPGKKPFMVTICVHSCLRLVKDLFQDLVKPIDLSLFHFLSIQQFFSKMASWLSPGVFFPPSTSNEGQKKQLLVVQIVAHARICNVFVEEFHLRLGEWSSSFPEQSTNSQHMGMER